MPESGPAIPPDDPETELRRLLGGLAPPKLAQKTGRFRRAEPGSPQALPKGRGQAAPKRREAGGIEGTPREETLAEIRATLAAIRAVVDPAAAVATGPNPVLFTTDRFAGTLPAGAEQRVPTQPTDRRVAAYFETRALGGGGGRCTFAWWSERSTVPLRIQTVRIAPTWQHQVDIAQLDGADWPAGRYHVLAYAVGVEPLLVAGGTFEIRAPQEFRVSGLGVYRDGRAIGDAVVLASDLDETLELRFESVSGAGRPVTLVVTTPAGKTILELEIVLESTATEPASESATITQRWQPGAYTAVVRTAGAPETLQHLEFTVKPPAAAPER